jgi:hypothetical protein
VGVMLVSGSSPDDRTSSTALFLQANQILTSILALRAAGQSNEREAESCEFPHRCSQRLFRLGDHEVREPRFGFAAGLRRIGLEPDQPTAAGRLAGELGDLGAIDEQRRLVADGLHLETIGLASALLMSVSGTGKSVFPLLTRLTLMSPAGQ